MQPGLQVDPASVEEVLGCWQLVQWVVEVACQEPWASLEEQGGGRFRSQQLGRVSWTAHVVLACAIHMALLAMPVALAEMSQWPSSASS